MNAGVITVSYIGAGALFILALNGLSNQESARRGNFYGMLGMGLALLVTVVGLVTANQVFLIGGIVAGGGIGWAGRNDPDAGVGRHPPQFGGAGGGFCRLCQRAGAQCGH